MTREDIKNRLAPYQDIIRFVVALLCANYFWKFTMQGDEMGDTVTWFGIDITAPFVFMARHIAKTCAAIIALFSDTVHYISPYIIRFDTGSAVKIIWGCTALKQSFIWIVIMLVARGPWKHKAWFIPLGLVFIYLFNMLRIIIIALVIEHHPDLFELLHTYIFKYLFYFMLFMLWVWWTEKFTPREP